MRTAGIIAEYNPFHNGHQYHIEETRKKTGADFIVTAISGDFVQRGAPALLDKYDRAAMALENGADLVLELPVTAALSSAEGFASGGVCLFEKLRITDMISFGCEDDSNDSLFLQTAQLLAEEPDAYREELARLLRQGMSYPKAREQAVCAYLAPQSEQDAAQLSRLLSEPNNILGLEYQKTILRHHCHLEICRILRCGGAYNSTELSAGFSSATAIRRRLMQDGDLSGEQTAKLKGQVPPSVFSRLKSADREHRFLRENDFSDLLFYALLEHQNELDRFGPSGKDLACRTARLLEQFENWDQFALLLKSRNQTYTGISRYLAQILLHIRREDLLLAARHQYAPYARVLGFRKSAAPLMKELRCRSRIPVLMRLAGDRSLLNKEEDRLLQADLHASAVYNRILFSVSGRRIKSDWRQPLVIL